MAIFNGSKDKTLTAGDTFGGGRPMKFTVITDATIQDSEGNTFGTYTAGNSYDGVFPRGTFTVFAGSIKIWA